MDKVEKEVKKLIEKYAPTGATKETADEAWKEREGEKTAKRDVLEELLKNLEFFHS